MDENIFKKSIYQLIDNKIEEVELNDNFTNEYCNTLYNALKLNSSLKK